MLVGCFLKTVGTIEILPFGLQHRDGLALALQLGFQLRHLLGIIERVVLDRIGIACRCDESRDLDNVEQPDHRRPPRFSAVCGNSASMVMALKGSCGGVSVRAPARSFAERARGLRAISWSLGHTGPLVIASKVGSGAAAVGRWREPVAARPVRAAKNCFTMRSSSEWNVTTTRRPAGFRMPSAACNARTSSPSSSLTAMRSP